MSSINTNEKNQKHTGHVFDLRLGCQSLGLANDVKVAREEGVPKSWLGERHELFIEP